MMRFLRRLALALPLIAALPAPAKDPAALPLRAGETLDYRVSWIILSGAGEISVSALAATDPDGAPLLRVITTTDSRGLARLLVPFDGRSESLYDADSGRLLWIGESHSDARHKHAAYTVNLDYAKDIAYYADAENPNRVEALPFPPNCFPTDMITCLLRARNWDLKPGQTHEAIVLQDDDFFDLTVHALGYEKVRTPLGEFNTLVLEPRMERTPPKGMFKRGSTVRVWIAQDAQRLPVRFRVTFAVGAGVANLVSYQTAGSAP
jgi:hypothetical protein